MKRREVFPPYVLGLGAGQAITALVLLVGRADRIIIGAFVIQLVAMGIGFVVLIRRLPRASARQEDE